MHVAAENLRRSLQGSQPAIKWQIVDHALRFLQEHVLGTIPATVPAATARASAVNFLRKTIKPNDQRAILADMTKLGLAEWTMRNHFALGMAVRNQLRAVGYTEAALGVPSLDEVWAQLLHEALASLGSGGGP